MVCEILTIVSLLWHSKTQFHLHSLLFLFFSNQLIFLLLINIDAYQMFEKILCEYCRLIILLYRCICSHLQYKQQYRNSMTKLFADLELKKQKMEEQESKDKKRQKRRGGRCRVQGQERQGVEV